MKILLKKVIIAGFVSAACFSGAQAEVVDRTIAASASPEVLFQQIVVTATAMCNEAAGKGEVFDVTRCVDVVVARTIEELNRPTLTAYALAARPAIATV
jgi:hypothetical protein